VVGAAAALHVAREHAEGVAAAAAVVVDNDEVVWAEPDAGRIIRIAR
jgi:hypothetical protein